MKDLYIIGAGGLGKEMLSVCKILNLKKQLWKGFYFIDDNKVKLGTKLLNVPVIGTLSDFSNIYTRDTPDVLCAFGEPLLRKKFFSEFDQKVNFPTIADIDLLDTSINLEPGVFVHPRCNIMPDVTIKRGTVLSNNVSLGHDVTIGACCMVCPSAVISGNVIIGDYTFIGANACIKDELAIGQWDVIGMGAVVINNIANATIVAGNPAKHLKENTNKLVFK